MDTNEQVTEQVTEQPRRGRQTQQTQGQENAGDKSVTFEGDKGKVRITATNPVMIRTLKSAGLEQK